MPFVSITRLRLRSWMFVPQFFFHAARASTQVAAAPGCLSAHVLRDTQNVFWTRTLWDTGESMRAYKLSGAHKASMKGLLDWCNEASIVHWDQDSPEPPPWTGLERIMMERGRLSKVRHPNPAHTAFLVRPPDTSPSRVVRFR